jgi:hypothetical protein
MGGQDAEFVWAKWDQLCEEWSRVENDVETLQDELKEDKWLVVFRTVGQQAEGMMDSLEKVLTQVRAEFIILTRFLTCHFLQCHAFIWEVHRSQPKSLTSADSTSTSSSSPSRRASFSGSASLSDPAAIQSLLSTYVSLHRSFHQKSKYYVPSTERVLKGSRSLLLLMTVT